MISVLCQYRDRPCPRYSGKSSLHKKAPKHNTSTLRRFGDADLSDSLAWDWRGGGRNIHIIRVRLSTPLFYAGGKTYLLKACLILYKAIE